MSPKSCGVGDIPVAPMRYADPIANLPLAGGSALVQAKRSNLSRRIEPLNGEVVVPSSVDNFWQRPRALKPHNLFCKRLRCLNQKPPGDPVIAEKFVDDFGLWHAHRAQPHLLADKLDVCETFERTLRIQETASVPLPAPGRG